MAIGVSVYRQPDGLGGFVDCTNGGISAREDRLMLYNSMEECERAGRQDDPRSLVLTPKNFSFGKVHLTAVPAPKLRDGAWPMFGGNFCYTSDGRFPAEYPIPIHDRFE